MSNPDDHDRHKCKCCPGPKGDMGPSGPQGPQGVAGPQGQPGQAGGVGPMGQAGAQGPAGADGAPGLPGAPGAMGPRGNDGAVGPAGPQGQPGQAGSVGPLGPVGPQGNQGIPGVPGDCVECPCDCEHEFSAAYSSANQDLPMSPAFNVGGGTILFENLIYSTANIDLSNVGLNGQVLFKKAGWYRIVHAVCAALNPVSIPLIAWGTALFKNGVIVPGSTLVNMTLSPDQQANDVTQAILVHFAANDVMTIQNVTKQNLLLNAPTAGLNAVSNSASLNIDLVEAD